MNHFTKKFHWRGTDHTLTRRHGICHAPNKRVARAMLAEQGIVIQALKRNRQTPSQFGRVSTSLALDWIQQLCSLLGAGIPLYEAIALSDKSQNHKKLHAVIAHTLTAMQAGQAFSQALIQSPYALPDMLLRMTAIGESSGRLLESLTRLVHFWQTRDAQRKALKKAVRYPLVVLLCACLISLGMLLYLVPQFASFYAEQQTPLPSLTLGMIALSNALLHYGLLGGLFALCLMIALYRYIRRIPRLRKRLIILLMRTPNIGRLYQATLCRDWAETMAMMLGSGITLREALSFMLVHSPNPLLSEAMTQLLRGIEGGQSLHQGLQETAVFPEFTAHFVRLGEETGDMLPILRHLHQHYAEFITNRVEHLGSYIEPMLMLLTGLIIGTVVLAMYLPIFSMGAAL